MYDIEFVSEEVMRKNMEESGCLEKREMNLWKEWANLYGDQLVGILKNHRRYQPLSEFVPFAFSNRRTFPAFFLYLQPLVTMLKTFATFMGGGF